MYIIVYAAPHLICTPTWGHEFFIFYIHTSVFPTVSQLVMEPGLKPRVFDSQLHECLTLAWIFHKVYSEQHRISYNWLSSQKVVNTIGFFYLFSARSSVVQVWSCVWVCSLWWLAETFTINRNQTPHNSILQMMFIKWSFLLSQPQIIFDLQKQARTEAWGYSEEIPPQKTECGSC